MHVTLEPVGWSLQTKSYNVQLTILNNTAAGSTKLFCRIKKFLNVSIRAILSAVSSATYDYVHAKLVDRLLP